MPILVSLAFLIVKLCVFIQMDRQTDRQTDSLTDGQTDIQTWLNRLDHKYLYKVCVIFHAFFCLLHTVS